MYFTCARNLRVLNTKYYSTHHLSLLIHCTFLLSNSRGIGQVSFQLPSLSHYPYIQKLTAPFHMSHF